jgi:pulcherriminic acid synthase
MSLTENLKSVVADAFEITADRASTEQVDFPLMPLGTACDMGRDENGVPLIDPRIFGSREFQRNPYPYYHIMQDHYPVFHDKLNNCYFVTRYADINDAYFDGLGFNTIPKGSSNHVLGNTQLELSGIEHSRRRNLYGRHLVGSALTKRFGAICKMANDMIDAWFDPASGMAEHDPATGKYVIELGRAFANEFPIRVVCQVLGFPDDAQDRFFYWYKNMMGGIGGRDFEQKGLMARQDLEDFVEEIVEQRRTSPQYLLDDNGNQVAPDIISELCQTVIDGDYLSTEEITSNIALIVGGGGETTRGAILNMWYLLLQHPDQMAAVLAEDALWDAAFHETLRHSSSIGGQPRHNTFDIEMHGVKIPAGSLMHMVDWAANHDPRVFTDPEKFDIFRNDLYTEKIVRAGYRKEGKCNHMAFGVGPHLCPGAWISHQEASIGSNIMSKRVKNVRIVEDRMPKDTDGVSLAPIGLGAINELWLEFEKA